MATAPPSFYELLGFHMQGDLNGFTAYTSKRNKVVWFPKSPPLKPPSPAQVSMRNGFRIYGMVWQAFTPQQRATWLRAAAGANLRIHYYNLYVWYSRVRGEGVIRTVERQSGVFIHRPS